MRDTSDTKERSNQKLKILRVMQILLEETDENHGITVYEIISKLKNVYDINAERKGIYRDIDTLKEFGMDIEVSQENKSFYYRIISREYDLAELKLLVDAVQSSRFITEKRSSDLIKKIVASASRHEKRDLERHVYVNGRTKTDNKNILQNIDSIHYAIASNKKIAFHYFNWNAKKQRELRRGGELYSISPWELILANEYYYLVAYDDREKKIKHYRVDKMLDVETKDEAREGEAEFKGVDIADYSSRVFGMYGGDQELVHLECKEYMAGIMIDKFGRDVHMLKKGEDKITVSVNVALSDQFISWIIGLGEDVTITGPESVLDKVREMVEMLSRKYLHK